jgi:hypothetical protein
LSGLPVWLRPFSDILPYWDTLINFRVICFGFDGIILQHVTPNLAQFKCLMHNYVILWHQIQTNIKSKSQGCALFQIKQLYSNLTKKGNFYYLFKLNNQKQYLGIFSFRKPSDDISCQHET